MPLRSLPAPQPETHPVSAARPPRQPGARFPPWPIHVASPAARLRPIRFVSPAAGSGLSTSRASAPPRLLFSCFGRTAAVCLLRAPACRPPVCSFREPTPAPVCPLRWPGSLPRPATLSAGWLVPACPPRLGGPVEHRRGCLPAFPADGRDLDPRNRWPRGSAAYPCLGGLVRAFVSVLVGGRVVWGVGWPRGPVACSCLGWVRSGFCSGSGWLAGASWSGRQVAAWACGLLVFGGFVRVFVLVSGGGRAVAWRGRWPRGAGGAAVVRRSRPRPYRKRFWFSDRTSTWRISRI
ncbi:hypothetical protein FHR83_004548 [Actinoplanes campanulatus]|uniref:Uncharacterized protein n=1 Tax=Actinoplanes campanulatus TaxID=113559 RepID=A0A7W5AJ52_9ACTN|nr:hypothetical protein [Actinoplanes campanulatus]